MEMNMIVAIEMSTVPFKTFKFATGQKALVVPIVCPHISYRIWAFLMVIPYFDLVRAILVEFGCELA